MIQTKSCGTLQLRVDACEEPDVEAIRESWLAVIVKIKPVPVVLAEPEVLVVTLVDIDMPEDEEPDDEEPEDEEPEDEEPEDEEPEDEEPEDEEPEDEEPEDEEPEDEELEDEALPPVLLVEVEARMGPTDIDMLLLKLADDVEALLEPTETVVGDDMPVLVVLEIEEVVVVLEPIGLTLAEGFEVVLALIGATEEELEAYQSFQA
ncbi:hypothetical protein LTR43_011166 [Exophiala xenobiotica]